jgi:hypothetical protein
MQNLALLLRDVGSGSSASRQPVGATTCPHHLQLPSASRIGLATQSTGEPPCSALKAMSAPGTKRPARGNHQGPQLRVDRTQCGRRPWAAFDPRRVKTHTSRKCRKCNFSNMTFNLCPQHYLFPDAQFLQDVSTRAAGVGVFTRPGPVSYLRTVAYHVALLRLVGNASVEPFPPHWAIA